MLTMKKTLVVGGVVGGMSATISVLATRYLDCRQQARTGLKLANVENVTYNVFSPRVASLHDYDEMEAACKKGGKGMWATGTGFLVRPNLLVTCHHLVEGTPHDTEGGLVALFRKPQKKTFQRGRVVHRVPDQDVLFVEIISDGEDEEDGPGTCMWDGDRDMFKQLMNEKVDDLPHLKGRAAAMHENEHEKDAWWNAPLTLSNESDYMFSMQPCVALRSVMGPFTKLAPTHFSHGVACGFLKHGDYPEHLLRFSNSLDGGFSGGPVIETKRGDVIGMAIATSVAKGGPSVAVRASTIRRCYNAEPELAARFGPLAHGYSGVADYMIGSVHEWLCKRVETPSLSSRPSRDGSSAK